MNLFVKNTSADAEAIVAKLGWQEISDYLGWVNFNNMVCIPDESAI